MKLISPKSFSIVAFFYLAISFVSSSAAIFLTHGGGPYPILEPSLHKQMYDQLKKISSKYPSPRGIVFVSGHWEEDEWTMIDIDHPSFYYDYHGFPQQAYNLTYQIKSTSQLRSDVRKSLQTNGIKLKSNFRRGYDHGVFIPMMLMYESSKAPPVIELSIKRNLNVEEHFNFGKSLRELKRNGFLIVGSGASAHGGFGQSSSLKKSQQFSQDLSNIFMNQFNQQKILQDIKEWKSLRHSIQMHPRQQHLVPLFVVLGAYEGKYKQEQKYIDRFMNLSLRNYILQ